MKVRDSDSVSLSRGQANNSQKKKKGECVGIWVEQIVPHRLDVGMVLVL